MLLKETYVVYRPHAQAVVCDALGVRMDSNIYEIICDKYAVQGIQKTENMVAPLIFKWSFYTLLTYVQGWTFMLVKKITDTFHYDSHYVKSHIIQVKIEKNRL